MKSKKKKLIKGYLVIFTYFYAIGYEILFLFLI